MRWSNCFSPILPQAPPGVAPVFLSLFPPLPPLINHFPNSKLPLPLAPGIVIAKVVITSQIVTSLLKTTEFV